MDNSDIAVIHVKLDNILESIAEIKDSNSSLIRRVNQLERDVEIHPSTCVLNDRFNKFLLDRSTIEKDKLNLWMDRGIRALVISILILVLVHSSSVKEVLLKVL